MRIINNVDFVLPVKLMLNKVPLAVEDASTLSVDLFTDDLENTKHYTKTDIDASNNITVHAADVSTFGNGILYYNFYGKTVADVSFNGLTETEFYIQNSPEFHKPTCATAVSELINDAGYTTQSWVMEHAVTIEAIAGKQDTLVSGTNIKTINNISLLGPGNIDVSTGGLIDAYTKAQVDAKFAAEDASLRTWVENKNYLVANDVSTFTTKTYVDASINQVRSEIPVVPTNVSAFNNDAGYLTQHQSLSDYARTSDVSTMIANEDASVKAWVNSQGYLTQHQSLADYATKVYVDGSINQVRTEIPTVPTNVSAFNNDAGYLTQHQSLDDYTTKTYSDERYFKKTGGLINGAVDVSGNLDVAHGWMGTNYSTDTSTYGFYMQSTGTGAELKHITNNHTDAILMMNYSGVYVKTASQEGGDTSAGLPFQKVMLEGDSSAFVTKSYVDGSINQVRSEIPTVPTNVSAFTNDAGYLTQHQSLAGKQDVLVSGTNIKTINNQSILGSGNIDISTGTVDTYTKAQIDAKDASIVTWVVAQDYVDSSTFTTSQEVTSAAINSLIRDKADASTAATKTYVDGSINAVKALIPDVSAFTTKTYVDGSINLVRSEIPDVSGLASKEYVDGSINAVIAQIPTVPTNVSAFTNDAGYVDSSTLQQVEVVTAAAIAEVYEAIPTVPTNVSAFTNDAGYLTQHQSLAGKQDVLVSGTNIKTINNISLLGSGNIDISTGGLIDAYTKAESDAKYFQKTGGNITGSVDVSGNLDVHDGWMGTNATVDSSAYGFYMQITRNGSELKHITNDVTDGIIKLNHSGLFLRISGTEGSPAAGQTEYEMATKNYVDTAVGTIETALTNIIGA